MKKTFLIIASFICLVNFINGQQINQKHRIGVNAGSSFLGFNTNLWLHGRLINEAYSSPLPQFSYTYIPENKLGIGAAISYQYFYFNLLPINSQSSAVIMKINKLNFSLHTKFFVINNRNFDLFLGARIGRSFWFGNISFSQLYNYLRQIAPDFISNILLNKIVPTDIKFTDSFFSYQLNIGGNYYLNKNIGIKSEIAIGSPYWGLLGLNFRF